MIEYTPNNFAKGGGVRSGGIRSSPKVSPKPSPSKSGTTKSQQNATNSKPKSADKPKTSIKPISTTPKTTMAKKPSTNMLSQTGKRYSNEGYTVGNGYQPRFTNGYVAPAGSTVYYPQHDLFDYMLIGYLFSNDSPRNDQSVIVQPDGKEVVAKPQQQGTDGLLIFNWIMLILIALAIIGGGMWLINKYSKKKPRIKKANQWNNYISY